MKMLSTTTYNDSFPTSIGSLSTTSSHTFHAIDALTLERYQVFLIVAGINIVNHFYSGKTGWSRCIFIVSDKMMITELCMITVLVWMTFFGWMNKWMNEWEWMRMDIRLSWSDQAQYYLIISWLLAWPIYLDLLYY